MQKNLDFGDSHRIRPATLRRLSAAQKTALTAGGALALLGLAAPFSPQPAPAWLHLTVYSAGAALACAAGLWLSYGARSRTSRVVVRLLAMATAAPALAAMAASFRGAAWALPGLAHPMPRLVSAAFVFLGLLLFFLFSRTGIAAGIADAALFGLGWTVLTLVSEWMFKAMHIFGVSPPMTASPAMICLVGLLALAAILRRTGFGKFYLFLGEGMSSRIIRYLLPLLLILPFLRETARARLIVAGIVGEHSAAAALASAAALISVALLLVLGYYFQRLEDEIRTLSLRDELTGLYNLRGFRLMAEQELRLAQRSELPFSVMFVDLDELKMINDELGHAVGSSLLAQTAELLRLSFRETDVVGRIGGDEFAVAGHFSREGISLAAERLTAKSAAEQNRQHLRLSLSIGHVTARSDRHQSLEELLSLADAAMYQQKRAKKQQVMI
jgi:diguanylate cyclase (GGDEF)-like protein